VLVLAATCGGTIRGYTGHVVLPSYPGQYPNNLNCTWRLIGPPDHYLIVWFDELSMSYSHNCTVGDYVAVTEEIPFNGSGRVDLHFLSCVSVAAESHISLQDFHPMEINYKVFNSVIVVAPRSILNTIPLILP
jgi:hypothetical protein